MLVDGFDSSPNVMMPYNSPSYPRMLEAVGLRKAKDLLAYWSTPTEVNGAKVERVARRAAGSQGVTIRTLRMREFDREVETIWKLYNATWARNWGFVPMTREEFLHEAAEMKQILKPELVLIGEVEGRAVGFALALPNINLALKHAGGRLLPLGTLQNPVSSTIDQRIAGGRPGGGGGAPHRRRGRRILRRADSQRPATGLWTQRNVLDIGR